MLWGLQPLVGSWKEAPGGFSFAANVLPRAVLWGQRGSDCLPTTHIHSGWVFPHASSFCGLSEVLQLPRCEAETWGGVRGRWGWGCFCEQHPSAGALPRPLQQHMGNFISPMKSLNCLGSRCWKHAAFCSKLRESCRVTVQAVAWDSFASTAPS